MSAHRRWRGLSALVRDAVVHGSTAIETLQLETVRRPLAILETALPGSASLPVVSAIEKIHAAAVAVTHGSIRGVARLIDGAVGVGLDLAGHGDDEPPLPPDRS